MKNYESVPLKNVDLVFALVMSDLLLSSVTKLHCDKNCSFFFLYGQHDVIKKKIVSRFLMLLVRYLILSNAKLY